jgi:adenylate kinase family enzyme
MGCGSSSAKYVVKEEQKPEAPVLLERDLRPAHKDEVERVINEAKGLDVDVSFQVVPLTPQAWSAVTRTDEALKAAVEELDVLLAPYDPTQPAVVRVCNIGERDPGSKAPSQNGAWDACVAAQDACIASPGDEDCQWTYNDAKADFANALGDEYYAEKRADARRDAILLARALAMRRKHLLLECLKDPEASTHVRNRVLEALCTLPKNVGVLEALEEMNNEKNPDPGSAGSVVFIIRSPVEPKGAGLVPRICSEFGHNCLSVANAVEKSALGSADKLPTDVLINLVVKEMDALGPKLPIIVDGFPRSQADLIAWDAKYGVSVSIDFCIFFAFPESALPAVIPPDELDGAKERYKQFHESTAPLIRQFADASMLVDIDTSYPDEQIWKEVTAAFCQGVHEAQVLAMQRDGPDIEGDDDPASPLDSFD